LQNTFGGLGKELVEFLEVALRKITIHTPSSEHKNIWNVRNTFTSTLYNILQNFKQKLKKNMTAI